MVKKVTLLLLGKTILPVTSWLPKRTQEIACSIWTMACDSTPIQGHSCDILMPGHRQDVKPHRVQ